MKCSGKAIKRTSSDISPLSPARFVHINRLGKYFLDFDEKVPSGKLRNLRVNA